MKTPVMAPARAKGDKVHACSPQYGTKNFSKNPGSGII